MPCRYDFNDETGASLKLQNELNLVTRVACKLATALSDYGGLCDGLYELQDILDENPTLKIDKEVLDWIVEHERKDAIRKAALIESAKSKLTDDEREALGL